MSDRIPPDAFVAKCGFKVKVQTIVQYLQFSVGNADEGNHASGISTRALGGRSSLIPVVNEARPSPERSSWFLVIEVCKWNLDGCG